MADDLELDEWLQLQEFKRLGSSPGRYMMDVRHPLKSRRLDERPLRYGATHHHLFEGKQALPASAPCARCGQVVLLCEATRHSCFTRRCVSRRARG